MNRTCSAVLAVLFTVALSSAANEPAGDAKRLVGRWQGIEGVWSGKTLTSDQAKRCALTFHPPRAANDLSGGPRGMDLFAPEKVVRFKLGTSGKKDEFLYVTEWKGYSWSVKSSAKPPALQAIKQDGLKARSLGGVYRLEGDTLLLCIGFQNTGKWPAEFSSPRGSEVLLLKFKRSK